MCISYSNDIIFCYIFSKFILSLRPRQRHGPLPYQFRYIFITSGRRPNLEIRIQLNIHIALLFVQHQRSRKSLVAPVLLAPPNHIKLLLYAALRNDGWGFGRRRLHSLNGAHSLIQHHLCRPLVPRHPRLAAPILRFPTRVNWRQSKHRALAHSVAVLFFLLLNFRQIQGPRGRFCSSRRILALGQLEQTALRGTLLQFNVTDFDFVAGIQLLMAI